MSSYRFVVLGMPEACTLEVVLTLRECMCAALQMAERSMISELAVHEYVDSLGSSPEQLSVSFNASKSMVPPARGLRKPNVDIP